MRLKNTAVFLGIVFAIPYATIATKQPDKTDVSSEIDWQGVDKRPFGSIYGNSYRVGKRPFGPIYNTGVFGKRPFVGGYRSYKIGKRPFVGSYSGGNPFGKRSVLDKGINFDGADEMKEKNKRPFTSGGGFSYGKRPFVFRGYHFPKYGKRGDIENDSNDALYVLSGEVDDDIEKRPFTLGYGYRTGKRPFRIGFSRHQFGKRENGEMAGPLGEMRKKLFPQDNERMSFIYGQHQNDLRTATFRKRSPFDGIGGEFQSPLEGYGEIEKRPFVGVYKGGFGIGK